MNTAYHQLLSDCARYFGLADVILKRSQKATLKVQIGLPVGKIDEDEIKTTVWSPFKTLVKAHLNNS